MMGLTLFVLLSVLEIALVIWTCKKAKEKKDWRRNRMFSRLTQCVIVVIAILLPLGQKWRLIPALGMLVILFVIAVLILLVKRGKEDGEKKKGAAVASCVLSILVIGVLLVPAFLFTGYKGLAVTGDHNVAGASAILVDESRTDTFEQDGSYREVPVHFYYPADATDTTQEYPLVVFSHGAFGYYQSNTSTYMELASNGYVVVSLDHPHHAFFTHDTDGKLVIVDFDFIRTAMTINDDSDLSVTPESRLALYQEWMELRTADMEFVLDELEAAKQSASLDDTWFLSADESDTILSVLHETDTSAIGLMGHSMGGAASVAVGRDSADVSAVIDIDGTMLSEYLDVVDGEYVINDETYDVPVLEFKNWDSYTQLEEYLADGGRYPNDELMKHAMTGFSTTIRDTKHMDFTDLPLLSPILGKMLGSGERDTKETMIIVNERILEFFDCYLKGEGEFAVQDIY